MASMPAKIIATYAWGNGWAKVRLNAGMPYARWQWYHRGAMCKPPILWDFVFNLRFWVFLLRAVFIKPPGNMVAP